MDERTQPDHSEVIVFPPVIPVSGFLLGVLLNVPWPVASAARPPLLAAAHLAGGAIVVAGAAGFVWMVVTMRKAGTPIHNAQTPTTLVEEGPFRYTRNPMYLFGAATYAGLALLLAQPWSLALLPAVVAVTHYGVVLPEEAYLRRKFGSAYRQYEGRVPRWLW